MSAEYDIHIERGIIGAMPTLFRDGDTPVVHFDPRLEVSPFTLFRRLREGRAPSLIDVRGQPTGASLRGASRWPGPDWRPETDSEVLLFDDDGIEAVKLAQSLQQEGCEGVRALFGGLELYRFALDTEVVGHETFLVQIADNAE